MRYFIDAATELIRESGIENVTIRTVSDRAGFNSSSLYTYFDNMDHLLTFTYLDMMSDYFNDIDAVFRASDMDSLEKYVRFWTVYCQYSFSDPYPFLFYAHLV